MIISNSCIGAEAELKDTPAPITVVEDGNGDIGIVCTFKAGDKCLASAIRNLTQIKKEVLEHPRSSESEEYPVCLYTKEGLRMA